MAQLATILMTVLVALAFGLGVPLENVARVLQPTTVALSIVTAAVFVRLNRGMPSLDWKSLDIDERKNLTSEIVSLTLEYTRIVALNFLILVICVAGSIYGPEDRHNFPDLVSRVLSAGMGFLLALAAARMSYVVWRDYDIVKLQKKLIDGAGEKERIELETKSAVTNIEAMRTAGLKRVETAPPRAWGD